MKIVSKKLGASTSTMTVINTEEWALWPIFRLSMFRFDDVKYDANSILIIVPNQALVCVCCVCSYDTVSLETTFCCLMIWNHNSNTRLQSQRYFFLRIFKHHLVRVKHSQRFYLRRLAWVVDNFLSYIYILPVSLEQIFQVLTLPNKSLSSWSAKRSVCNLLLLTWVYQVISACLLRSCYWSWICFLSNFRCCSQISYLRFLLDNISLIAYCCAVRWFSTVIVNFFLLCFLLCDFFAHISCAHACANTSVSTLHSLGLAWI